MNLKLKIIEGSFAVCKLAPEVKIPDWVNSSCFFSITKSSIELSIVCESLNVPDSVKSEMGWSLIKVDGVLDFSLTGILSSLSSPLAKAQISIFAISTFDTDYLLVKETNLVKAKQVLQENGFELV